MRVDSEVGPAGIKNSWHLGALAVRHAQQGRLDEAVHLLQLAVDRDPSIPDLHNNFGMTLYSLQRIDEAIAAYRKALRLRPGYALAHNNLGVALAARGDHSQAIAVYHEALAIRPDYAEALSNLGASLHADARSADAIERFRAALALQPEFLEARVNLGHALSALGRSAEAIPCYEAAIKERPDDATAHLNLATALRDVDRYAQAAEHYERAIALAPDLTAAHSGLGTVHLESGRVDDARQCFERAIRLEPRRPNLFLDLSRSMTFTTEHPCLSLLLDLAHDMGTMSDTDKINVHFSLAKAMADIGDQPSSFSHQLAGNALKRSAITYEETRTLEALQRIRNVFTEEFLERQNLGVTSPDPIFIIGMPRSGSTLVEQILASHPQVFGAGETDAFDVALRTAGLRTVKRPFPESVPEWTTEDFHGVADRYLKLLRTNLPLSGKQGKARRITDKMLTNFRYAGLIHLMLPRARIIHTQRDPIDTCLSCFSIQFAGLHYTYDLGELGRYYSTYAHLMEHWRAVLPAGRMLEVQYEETVTDFEATARRIIAHCGLQWDDACLRFYETQRPVRTSSVTQVRRPIYQSSVGRWRPPDENALRPLLDALGMTSNLANRTCCNTIELSNPFCQVTGEIENSITSETSPQ